MLSKISIPLSWRDKSVKMALLFLTLFLGMYFSPIRHGTRIFLELGNLADVLRQVSETGILAIGMTIVILTAGIDLSVGAVLALSATVMAKALMVWHWGLFKSAALCLSIGLSIGIIYSILIAKFRIPPFVATLAGMGALRGIARLVGDGSSIAIVAADPSEKVAGAPAAFFALAGKWGGAFSFPGVLYLCIAVAVAFWLSQFVSGRRLFAVGGSEKAARFAGIRVGISLAFAYGLCSLLAALGGIIHAAQMEQGNPNDGMGYELDAIAAVVIGGTRLTGGVGTVFGTVVGTIIIGILNNILGLNNIDINIQLIIKGILILGATAFQQIQFSPRRTT